MAASLRGDLKDFGIADVFQLIGQQRKTGILEFNGDGQQIQILFDQGAVVSAAPVGSWPGAAFGEMLMRCGLLSRDRTDELRRECGASARTLSGVAIARGWLGEGELRKIEELLTRETIFSVLRWEAGSFDFTANEIEHGRSVDSLLGAEQILMDGLRMVDEWQSFADLVPSEDTVFRRLLSFEQYPSASSSWSMGVFRCAASSTFPCAALSIRFARSLSYTGPGSSKPWNSKAWRHPPRSIQKRPASRPRSAGSPRLPRSPCSRLSRP